MSRKTLALFVGLFVAIVGLTILRDIIKGSPLVILGISSIISAIVALMSIYFTNQKRNHVLVNDKKVLESSLIDKQKAYKIKKILYAKSKKANIQIPQISIFESIHKIAYSYQFFPNQSYIKLSHSLVNTYSMKSIAGIIAHEISHIKNRDSWKSILRFVNWVFVLSVGFFFVQKSSIFLIPIIVFYELNEMREKEYLSDYLASTYSSLDEVLNCLLDSYYLQYLQRIEIQKNHAGTGLSHQWNKFWQLFNYDLQILIFNYLGTHPNWKSRINHCLMKHHIELSGSEMDLLLKKLIVFRQTYGLNRAIDWNKMGLVAEKIKIIKK